MARTLDLQIKQRIKEEYLLTGNILKTARRAGSCRNTVKRVLRAEGLYGTESQKIKACNKKSRQPQAAPEIPDLFAWHVGRVRYDPDVRQFYEMVLATRNKISEEIGAKQSPTDSILLDQAMLAFLDAVAFSFKARMAVSEPYKTTYAKSHDKLAQAINRWMKTSLMCQESFRKTMSVLRYQNIKPEVSNLILHQQNQMNISHRNCAASRNCTETSPDSIF